MNFGRIIQMDCINVVTPPDARCSDPAFAIANPGICGVQSSLIIKPGNALVCAMGSIQFKVFALTNGVEEDVTEDAVFASGDLNTAVIGATSGNATGLIAGETMITATYNGMTATAQLTVLSGDNCCSQQTVALMLLVDATKSMSQQFGGAYSKRLTFAKAAATQVVNQINADKDTIGLAQFHGNTVVVEDSPGTATATVLADIAAIAETTDKTQFYDAVTDALATLSAASADRKVLIIISDGEDTLTNQFDESNDPLVPLSEFKGSGGIVMCLGVRASGTGFALLSAMATGGFFVNAYPDNVDDALAYFTGLKGYLCAGNCTPDGDEIVSKGELSYAEFINWDVTDGSVDLCGNGFFDFLPGNGLYIDMQGTSYPQTGRMTSKNSYLLAAGHVYQVTFWLAGNQRADQGTQTLRVRVFPTNGGPALLDQSVAIPDYTQGFQRYSLTFNSPGAVDVKVSFNQVEWTGVGVSARIGLLLDDVSFENATTGEVLLWDNFDNENPTYVTPGCGPGTTWTFLADLNAYGYAYGYNCDGEGCLDEPPAAQLPDPNPLSNIESGDSPPSQLYTSTRQACAECEPDSIDIGELLSPVLSAANLAMVAASSEANTGMFACEAWLAFDEDTSTYWASNGSVPQWLSVKLDVAEIVGSYGLRTLFVGKPTAWTFQGSQDGVAWTTLDTRTDPTGTLLIPNIENIFPITTPASYLYYRINVTAVNSTLTFPGDPVGGVSRAGIVELTFYGVGTNQICESATATSYESQAKADSDAYNAALAEANAQLNCRSVYTSTKTHTEHCPQGAFGTDATASATATSFVSQEDADAQALAAAVAAAQAALDCAGSNNDQAISIPDMAPASPYPSVKFVEGEVGVIVTVTVSIFGLSHGFPPDIHMVLVSPSGTKVELMRNAGDNTPDPLAVSNLDLVFDDAAAAIPETAAALVSGTYSPSAYGVMASLPTPAPGAPYSGMLSSFAGEDPNGAWALYVADDYPLDVGSIASGWDLTFTLV